MNKQPRSREFQSLAKTKDHHVNATDGSWHRLVSAITDPDLLAIAAFCLIGLLLMLNLMLLFPDLGALIAQYNQF
jgi:hypothetical protein